MQENPWWRHAPPEADLAQGELLYGCAIPIVPDDFDPAPEGSARFEVRKADLTIVTQTCDLVSTAKQNKTDVVAACQFRRIDPSMKGDKLEQVRKGREEGVYLLACPADHNDLKGALLVDFRRVYTLPKGYLIRVAARNEPRYQLQSPYVEHFSQAFARLFMRVARDPELGDFTKVWATTQ
jgi:hypothetical protein